MYRYIYSGCPKIGYLSLLFNMLNTRHCPYEHVISGVYTMFKHTFAF